MSTNKTDFGALPHSNGRNVTLAEQRPKPETAAFSEWYAKAKDTPAMSAIHSIVDIDHFKLLIAKAAFSAGFATGAQSSKEEA